VPLGGRAVAVPGVPRDEDGPVFREPWEARAFAMALALRPRVLLLDEPTAGMGEQETFQVAGLIRRLHKHTGYTIVLIEHDMRVVFNLADRIMVLAEGSLLVEGTPQEIAENPAVQAAYLGRAE